MKYAEIKRCDSANGPGVRTTLFVSGCTHRCKGCFNAVAWDFSYGKDFDRETEEYLIRELKPGYIRGLTLLGGEPMEPANQEALLPFIRRVKEIYPKKDIWCYTGYVYTEEQPGKLIPQCPQTEELLSLIDVLVDGPFIEAQKKLMLRFRGSENQRLIDMKATRQAGHVVLWDK